MIARAVMQQVELAANTFTSHLALSGDKKPVPVHSFEIPTVQDDYPDEVLSPTR
jgi:hypothetical protein